MQYVEKLDDKISAIRAAFEPLIGTTFTGYECGEIFLDDVGEWDRWDDLPVRLHFGDSRITSVSWTGFNELLVMQGAQFPDWVHESTKIRWVSDSIPELSKCVGRALSAVSLGRGEMTIEGRDIEVWTRLVLEFDGLWFEVLNALDENGYDYHALSPEGEFRHCA